MSKKTIFIIAITVIILCAFWAVIFLTYKNLNYANNNGQQTADNNSEIKMSGNSEISDKALENDYNFIVASESVFENQLNALDVDIKLIEAENYDVPDPLEHAMSFSTMLNQATDKITKRIDSINELVLEAEEIKNISESVKNSLLLPAQDALPELTEVKNKLGQVSDISSALSYYESAMAMCRKYDTLILKIKLILTADKALTVSNAIKTVGQKIDARVSVIDNINLSTLSYLSSDFNSKAAELSKNIGKSSSQALNIQLNNKVQLNLVNSIFTDIKTASSQIEELILSAEKIIRYLRS